MARYAQGTQVSASRSKEEIESILRRAGIRQFATAEEPGRAAVMFAFNGISYRMQVAIPDPEDESFTFTPSRKWQRSEAEAFKAWEDECKRRWRSLVAVIKAKLIAVAEGVVEFEQEFVGYAVLANGRTVADEAVPMLRAAAADGRPARLALPEAGDA